MLRPGAKGAAVKDLQERLAALGYWNGKADGEFGSVTRQAVFALQKGGRPGPRRRGRAQDAQGSGSRRAPDGEELLRPRRGDQSPATAAAAG
jgi:peptidoglycan hydrolase-like protein with peptidoglycan-binding domain